MNLVFRNLDEPAGLAGVREFTPTPIVLAWSLPSLIMVTVAVEGLSALE